jgi:hypothetical protein
MSKGWKITFYISTIILSLSMLWGGFLDGSQNELAVAGITSLGYPAYFAVIIGVAKILGVIGIWQNKVKFLRSWAYAGFTFDTLGAFISTLASGIAFMYAVPALISLVIVLISFASAKKMGRI